MYLAEELFGEVFLVIESGSKGIGGDDVNLFLGEGIHVVDCLGGRRDKMFRFVGDSGCSLWEAKILIAVFGRGGSGGLIITSLQESHPLRVGRSVDRVFVEGSFMSQILIVVVGIDGVVWSFNVVVFTIKNRVLS